MKISAPALLMAASLALAGCGDVTVYEPGVYQGKSDPLVEELRSEELREALAQRAELQRDR